MPGVQRSPIDHALRELVQIELRHGHGRNISWDEAVHLSQSMSRRSFLGTAAAAGAGLLVAGAAAGDSGPVDPPTISARHTPRVVILGAGLAGLTVAYRLHQAGISTQVLEARDRVGGRCWSARQWSGGQVAEHGGEFIDTRHVHTRGLAAELGLPLDDLWRPYTPYGRWLSYVDGEITRTGPIMEPLREAARSLADVAKRNGPYFAGQASARARAFDEMTEAEWVREATGQPMKGAMGRVFATGQAGWYGLDPNQLGASNLIDYFAVDFPGGDERYTTRGGNDLIPQGLHDALPSGTVHLESAVESIVHRGNGPYHVRVAGSRKPIIADLLVLTLPFTALRNIDLEDAGLSPAKMRAINELGMGTNAKLLLQFDETFHEFDRWSGGVSRSDKPRWSTWDSGNTDSPRGSRRYGLMTVYSGGRVGAGWPAKQAHGVAPRSVVDTTLQHLNQMIPGTRAAYHGKAWLDVWAKDPWVNGSYAAFLPGQTTSFMGMMGRAEGRAHFAGEHTSTYSQGFLNGGTESGSRVAKELLDRLARPYPPGLARALRQQKRFEPVYPW